MTLHFSFAFINLYSYHGGKKYLCYLFLFKNSLCTYTLMSETFAEGHFCYFTGFTIAYITFTNNFQHVKLLFTFYRLHPQFKVEISLF